LIKDRILWINTGGTLVSAPYDDPKEPPENVSPLPFAEAAALVMQLLSHINGSLDRVDGYSFGTSETQFLKDSKLFTPDDIRELAGIIASDTEHDKVLITHGTDKMAENATLLKKFLAEMGVEKTVVFVGSMLPLSMEEKFPHMSDAQPNMMVAMHEIDRLAPGVYVTGRTPTSHYTACVDPSALEKDRQLSKATMQFTLRGR